MPAQWDFACPDWEKKLADGLSPIPILPLDKTEADRAAAIFDKLKLPDVPGNPLFRDAAGQWQRDLVRQVFGSLVDGVRMVREVFAMVPKKSSKTTGGAGIGITAMLMNKRPRAEFLYVGPRQDVADLAFQQAVGIIEADPYLAKRFHIAQHIKTITDRRNKSRLKVKTFDMKVMTGTKPVFVLLDEVHVMSAMNGAARIIGQIRGGLLANAESVLLMITTQSDQPPAGAFKAELQYARGVRDGRIKDGSLLAMIFEFSEKEQQSGAWRNSKLWPKVLPNLGKPVTLDRLIKDYEAAKEKGEEEERRWASQHINLQIGLALHSDRWIGADYWLAAGRPEITLDHILSVCDAVVLGIDGGGLEDLLGLGVIGRHRKTREWLLWNHAWAHEDVFKRRKEIAPRLEDFIREGTLTRCKEPTQDIREVVAIAKRIKDAGLLPKKQAVGLDPVGVAAIVDELDASGIGGEQLVGVTQGYKLSGSIWGMERKLKDGTLTHAGQDLMAWCVGNAKTEQRGNAILITKEAAGKAKIDPLAAAFNAVALMSRNPPSAIDLSGWLSQPAMAV